MSGAYTRSSCYLAGGQNYSQSVADARSFPMSATQSISIPIASVQDVSEFYIRFRLFFSGYPSGASTALVADITRAYDGFEVSGLGAFRIASGYCPSQWIGPGALAIGMGSPSAGRVPFWMQMPSGLFSRPDLRVTILDGDCTTNIKWLNDPYSPTIPIPAVVTGLQTGW